MATVEEYATQPLQQRLGRLESTADELVAVTSGHPPVMLARRPDEKNWSAVEVICHLRDVEEAFGGRFQLFLAMDGVPLLPIDVDRWAVDRQYLRGDANRAIEAFRRRRAENLDLLRTLTPEQWKRGGLDPTRGRRTFEDLVTVLAWHDDNHSTSSSERWPVNRSEMAAPFFGAAKGPVGPVLGRAGGPSLERDTMISPQTTLHPPANPWPTFALCSLAAL